MAKMKFKLLLFGDDSIEADNQNVNQNQDVDTETTTKQGEEEEKTFTQAEVDELLKKYKSDEEVEEIVKKRLARERRKAEDEKKEAERLSKLSADERAKEESKKKDERIAELEAKIERNILEKDTIDRLNQEGLPIEFKSFLMLENAEKTNEAIKTFKEKFDATIQAEVEKRFKGKTPPASGGNPKTDVWDRISKKYK